MFPINPGLQSIYSYQRPIYCVKKIDVNLLYKFILEIPNFIKISASNLMLLRFSHDRGDSPPTACSDFTVRIMLLCLTTEKYKFRFNFSNASMTK